MLTLNQRPVSGSVEQKIRFLIAGGMGACFEIGLFWLLSTQFEWPKLSASIVGTTLGVLFNYWLSINLVFERGKHSARAEFLGFALVSAAVIALNQLIFLGLLWAFPTHPTLCKAGAILLLAVVSYFWKKRFVFKG